MNNSLPQLIIIGAGGAGQEVAWAATSLNSKLKFSSIAYADDNPEKKGTVLYGYPTLGSIEEINQGLVTKPHFICGVGNNLARIKLVNQALLLGWTPVSIIDPTVMMANDVTIGEGTYIAAGVILSPNSKIGDHVIINHHCSIGHDSQLSDFCQASPGSRISGFAKIGYAATIGSNAIVAPGKSVGDYATLGAASFGVINVPAKATAIGVPAKVIFLTD
jgi:sugar O-acyltransferase (sialic acid O-acetyltransferase NeuD family)